jgi:CRISPR/Cas system CSM-associated protein Csm3 (group 7 of RAMP superfamily)
LYLKVKEAMMHLQIELTAVFTTPFNVGTGALANTYTDRPTIKNGQQRPIIPGSSYKGRLRHTCEQILRALQQDDAAACQPPVANQMCPLNDDWAGQYCPICRLFGSPNRHGPLRFSDLQWDALDSLEAPTEIRTGVAIRRSRRVAEPQKLYNQELFGPLPQTRYTGEIVGHLVDDDSQQLAALLVAGLRQMHTIGGGQTGGLGHCTFETKIRIDGRLQDDTWFKEELARWLFTT